MRTGPGNGHLSYCTNIHPGESWQQVRENLELHLPAVRDGLMQRNPQHKSKIDEHGFGVGLRLSGQACYTLAQSENLEWFKDFLATNNFYVFTLNGFPYGAFHGTRVKEDVYLPDWRDSERVNYSKQLGQVLAAVLPEQCNGSISTVPVAFKATVDGQDQIDQMTRSIIEVVADLVELDREKGRHITLALEPEPCCYLETIAETIDYFNQHLRSGASIKQLCESTGLGKAQAEVKLKEHLSVCLDACHAAVEFEDARASVEDLRAEGIEIGKLQISSGLRMTDVSIERARLLSAFDDETYLHQVVETNAGKVRRYPDLSDAFEAIKDGETRQEWRVHCHVPLFLDDFGEFSSTQFYVSETLEQHNRQPVSEHLEVETYTWSVLPEQYRGEDMDNAIARELDWVLQRLDS